MREQSPMKGCEIMDAASELSRRGVCCTQRASSKGSMEKGTRADFTVEQLGKRCLSQVIKVSSSVISHADKKLLKRCVSTLPL